MMTMALGFLLQATSSSHFKARNQTVTQQAGPLVHSTCSFVDPGCESLHASHLSNAAAAPSSHHVNGCFLSLSTSIAPDNKAIACGTFWLRRARSRQCQSILLLQERQQQQSLSWASAASVAKHNDDPFDVQVLRPGMPDDMKAHIQALVDLKQEEEEKEKAFK
jgi:hypothetical protein